jgi:hypothetical protein
VRPPRFPSGSDPQASLNGSADQHRRWRHANKRADRLYEVALAVKADVSAAYRDVAVCRIGICRSSSEVKILLRPPPDLLYAAQNIAHRGLRYEVLERG